MTTSQVSNTARWASVITGLGIIASIFYEGAKVTKAIADNYVESKINIENLKNKDRAIEDKQTIQSADIAELRGKFTDNDHKNELQDLKITGCELDISRLKLKTR